MPFNLESQLRDKIINKSNISVVLFLDCFVD